MPFAVPGTPSPIANRRFHPHRRIAGETESYVTTVVHPDRFQHAVLLRFLPPVSDDYRSVYRELARLQSPRIENVKDDFWVNGRHAVAVDITHHHPLSTLPRPPLGVVAAIGIQIARALDAAWNHCAHAGEPPLRQAHGDVRAPHVGVEPEGRVQLTHFAQCAGDPHTDLHQLIGFLAGLRIDWHPATSDEIEVALDQLETREPQFAARLRPVRSRRALIEALEPMATEIGVWSSQIVPRELPGVPMSEALVWAEDPAPMEPGTTDDDS